MARVRVQVPVEQTTDPREALPDTVGSTNPNLRQLVTKGNVAIGLVAILVLIVIFMLFSLLNDRKQLKQQVSKLSTAQPSGQNDTQRYQEEIGKIVELPTGQTPSLVTVSDSKKLASENAFFKNAKDGDVVLLYVSPDKSVRAILYRPSSKKIVEATSSATVGSGGTTPVPSTKR